MDLRLDLRDHLLVRVRFLPDRELHVLDLLAPLLDLHLQLLLLFVQRGQVLAAGRDVLQNLELLLLQRSDGLLELWIISGLVPCT